MFMDHDVEEKYLKLEELGSVLRQLNNALPGKYSVLAQAMECNFNLLQLLCKQNEASMRGF